MSDNIPLLQEFLKNLTIQPGVYRMLNQQQEVIYVGKAKNLRNRVTSYFRGQLDNAKTRVMVNQVVSIEITVTHTEAEALILENNFIKTYQPKYNVLLRDDKSYPYILLTNHKHPRITLHRGKRKGEGDYFGPYPSTQSVYHSLRLMQKIFPVRQCEDSFYRSRTRPCLQYQIGRCSAPCVSGKVSDEDYAQQVQMVKLFLSGKGHSVIQDLAKNMEQASQALQFEQAAKIRDQIRALQKIQEQQYVAGQHDELDVIGFYNEGHVTAAHILYIRDHRIIGSKNYFPKQPKNTDVHEILQAFLSQFYLNTVGGQKTPHLILTSQEIDNHQLLASTLTEQCGYKIQIVTATRGEKFQYQQLADKNAQVAVKSRLAEKAVTAQKYQALNDYLPLERPISRMECFDISHTQGEQTIASCVVFDGEGPLKSDYRRYNVEGITPGDDYAAMSFALEKRYSKLTEESKIPDLIFIDGGKGQLARAEKFFEQWSHEKMPLLVGVAKGIARKPGLETLIFEGGMREHHLDPHSPALHLIQSIRDEAHRFAISGHRNKRAKVKKTSTLEQIPGVGPNRRRNLLKHFGGLQGVLGASISELIKLPGISQKQAQIIYDALHPEDS